MTEHVRNPPETAENGSYSDREVKRVERAVVRKTNKHRSDRGLQPLERNNSLDTVADYYAWKMWNEGFYSHVSPEGNKHGDRLIMYGIWCMNASDENINHGYITDDDSPTEIGEDLVDSWMDSPSHREAILTPEYSYIGVGVFVNGSEVWAVQLFCERIKIEEGSIADRHGGEGQERIPSRQRSETLFQVQSKLEPSPQ